MNLVTFKKVVAVTVAVTIAGSNARTLATRHGQLIGAQVGMPTIFDQWVPYLYVFKGAKRWKYAGLARLGNKDDCMDVFKIKAIHDALEDLLRRKFNVVLACKKPGYPV